MAPEAPVPQLALAPTRPTAPKPRKPGNGCGPLFREGAASVWTAVPIRKPPSTWKGAVLIDGLCRGGEIDGHEVEPPKLFEQFQSDEFQRALIDVNDHTGLGHVASDLSDAAHAVDESD